MGLHRVHAGGRARGCCLGIALCGSLLTETVTVTVTATRVAAHPPRAAPPHAAQVNPFSTYPECMFCHNVRDEQGRTPAQARAAAAAGWWCWCC